MNTLQMDPLVTDILRQTLAEARAPIEILPKFEASLAQIMTLEGCIASIITSRPNENGFEVVTVRFLTQLPGEPGRSNIGITNGSDGRLTDQQIAELRRAASGSFKVRLRIRDKGPGDSTVLFVEVLCEKCPKSKGSDDGESF